MPNLGKYEIHEQLGTGSMGTVYRARDTVIHRDVALKTIRTGADIETEMRERFYREARSCGRLQHPNIVTIYDLGEQDHTAYIAMELLEGADFRKVIEERRVESLPDKLELMIQICEALGHAHRHGVIHRDIKPSNVFLAGPKCIKVLDFGIARLPSSRLTVAGNVLGTPNYMAPEQILAKPCDGRTDLFSAGVVFFEFVTGQHPFRGSLIPQRIVESEPDSLFDHDSSLPVLLEKVFMRALAKQPDQRYATGAAFASDLRTVLDALRQNSSPSFSRITLPSERETPGASVSSAAKPTVAPMRAPEGEDSAEWRYSKVLGLIPLFEEALERNDAAEAQRQFESLERVTTGDERFNEAVNGCRARLGKISPVPKLTPKPKSTSPRVCVQCGAENRSAARFCIQCGADLDDEEMEEQEAGTTKVPDEAHNPPTSLNPAIERDDFDTIFDGTVVQTRETPAELRIVSELSTKSPERVAPVSVFSKGLISWIQKHPGKAVADVAAVVLIVAAGFGLRAIWGGEKEVPKKINLETAVASARADLPTVNVYDAKAANSRKLYYVSEGTRVNVLEMPTSDEKWIPVQAIFNGTPQPTGFVQRDQLNEWKGLDITSAFAICCRFVGVPTEGKEFERRRLALADFASEFPDTAEARKALTEKARLGLELTKFHQTQGLSGDQLHAELTVIREDAVKAGETANDIVVEIDKLLAEIAGKKPEVDFAMLITSARNAIKQNQIDKAERIVSYMLYLKPRNADALELQKQIKAIRDADP